ncbi:MAG TPA: choice-of-anchor tandem repeat GloVer-containing protein [Terriglobales bacterium]|jgi:hypothetical protein|nr:choice-of-anchor tandem repeat GloVer-containing protein [Terriglobales bacterium]
MSPKNWFFSASRKLALLVIVVMVASGVSVAEWKEKVLYNFQGGNDGAVPAGGVVFDKQGNLFGATSDGGSGCTSGSCGTVFQLVPPVNKGSNWSKNILHNFQGQDGSIPEGGVILDAAGNVYGTTAYGGSGPCTLFGSTVGCGVVYEMVPPKTKNGAWTEKVLYNFLGNKDGQFPWGDLVFDKSGNLYGATQFGGGYGSCDAPFYQHCGTIFKLSPPQTKGGKWKEKVLYSFKNGKDGANPNGGLIFDQAGALYGTTYSGGSTTNCVFTGFAGCGTVFRLQSTAGEGAWSEQVLYRIKGRPDDGVHPLAGVTLGTKGDVYGTAIGGGKQEGGVVFQLVPPGENGGSWIETVIHAFSLGGDGGASPMGGLIIDGKGNLLGTTNAEGVYFGGTVFRLGVPGTHGEKWDFGLLYSFKGPPDAQFPAAQLFPDKAGHLYSTTQNGGTGQSCQGGCGSVFELAQ